MSLLEKFNERMSKSKVAGADNKSEFDVLYPTGFDALDMLNGQRIYVNSKDRNFSYIAGGIVDGSSNTFIARSGVGKSTLIMQCAANIIVPFIRNGFDANLFIDDIEGGLPEARREFLLGMTQEELESHVIVRNSGITTENVLERLTAIADEKTKNKKDYTYDTGKFDTYGNRIFKLVPTVYVIDSLAMLMPEDVTEKDDLGTNMTGSSVAKQNTMLFKKINQLCKSANIILFTVNHILDKIQLGFLPEPAQIDGLKTNERIASAKTILYLANNIFRLDDKTTLKQDDGFGINGKVVDVTLIKSRTNATRRSVPLIFDKSNGHFDNILSLFYILKQEGLFTGIGNNMRIDGCDIKFGMKNFKEVLESSEELQKAFAAEVYNVISRYPSDTKVRSAENYKASTNITSLISEMGLVNYVESL